MSLGGLTLLVGVDIVYINQDDKAECCYQVRLMLNIYNKYHVLSSAGTKIEV